MKYLLVYTLNNRDCIFPFSSVHQTAHALCWNCLVATDFVLLIADIQTHTHTHTNGNLILKQQDAEMVLVSQI